MEDFPLEQSRDDTLRFALDQVIQIDGHLVCPDTAQAYPHFILPRHSNKKGNYPVAGT